MYLTKKRLYVSIVLIFIVTIGIVLFLQPIQVNKATEEMVERLNEKYDDQFEVMWSNIERMSVETFNATVKSNKTGYIYDVAVNGDQTTMQYDKVNDQMAINKNIEKQISGVFAMTMDDSTVLLTTVPVTEEKLLPLQNLFDTSLVTVIQLDEKSYSVATKHIDQYYQRSTTPLDELDQYKPKTTTIEFKK
ncbi:MAG: hypothetical protein ABS882_14250 [Lysinibacillus sp.]